MKSGNNQDGLCNWLKVKANYSEMGIRLGANNNVLYCLHITDNISGVSDVETWKTYLQEHQLCVVYPLATPITIQLTPTQVRTLLGQNQIYANTGNINKIVYFKTGSETVARMIEAYMRS